ncbi:MAG: response regulator transcription factor [Sulfurimonas sp.]|nr:response regulator transcription factor [Sulfurimonas sp.]
MSGGDDYITKPFILNELLLRINAILKRVYKNENIIEINKEISFNTQELTLMQNGKLLHLTAKETKLLSFFLQNRDTLVTREEIFAVLYDYEEQPSEPSLRVFINKLRKIIGKEKIETIKNLGYRYVS